MFFKNIIHKYDYKENHKYDYKKHKYEYFISNEKNINKKYREIAPYTQDIYANYANAYDTKVVGIQHRENVKTDLMSIKKRSRQNR